MKWGMLSLTDSMPAPAPAHLIIVQKSDGITRRAHRVSCHADSCFQYLQHDNVIQLDLMHYKLEGTWDILKLKNSDSKCCKHMHSRQAEHDSDAKELWSLQRWSKCSLILQNSLFFIYEWNVQKKLVKRETRSKGSGTFFLVHKTAYACNCVCTLTIFSCITIPPNSNTIK